VISRIATIGLGIILISGCSSLPASSIEKLDTRTGSTITSSPVPMILYRDDPGRAANARNFVSFGPLQVNRSGSYQYFIWLGIWNTNHSLNEADGRDGFDAIVLIIDGEPITLDVSGWTPDAIGASEPVYLQPVASAIDAYYLVTLDQIRLLAEADELYLQTTGPSPRSFEPWNKQTAAREGFQTFLKATY
jgi:hypothetical protein